MGWAIHGKQCPVVWGLRCASWEVRERVVCWETEAAAAQAKACDYSLRLRQTACGCGR